MKRYYIELPKDMGNFEITAGDCITDEVEAPTHYVDVDDDKLVPYCAIDQFKNEKLQKDLKIYQRDLSRGVCSEEEAIAADDLFYGLFDNNFFKIKEYFVARYAYIYVFDQMGIFCRRFGYTAWQYDFDGEGVITYFVRGRAIALNPYRTLAIPHIAF